MQLVITSPKTSANSFHLAVERFIPAAAFIFDDFEVGDICVSANGFGFFTHSGELAKAFSAIAHGYDASIIVTVVHPAVGKLFFDVSVRLLVALISDGKDENAKAGREFCTLLEPGDLDTQEKLFVADDVSPVPEGREVGDDSYVETPSIVEQAWELFETFKDKSFLPSHFFSRYEKEDRPFSSSSRKTSIDPADVNMVAPPEIPAAKYINVFRSDAHNRKPEPLAQILSRRVMPMLDPEDIRCVFDAMMEAPRLEREVVEVIEVPEPEVPNPYAGMRVTWADLPVKPARDPPPKEDDRRRSKQPEEKRNVLDLEVEFRIARYQARKARAKATVLKLKCKPIIKKGWLSWLWNLIPAQIREPVENRARSVLGWLSWFWPWVPSCIRLPTERRVRIIRDRIELSVDQICDGIKRRVYAIRDTFELGIVRFFRQQMCDRTISVFSLPIHITAAVDARVTAVVHLAARMDDRSVQSSQAAAFWRVARGVKKKFDAEAGKRSWLSSLWSIPRRVKDRVERKIMSYIPCASF